MPHQALAYLNRLNICRPSSEPHKAAKCRVPCKIATLKYLNGLSICRPSSQQHSPTNCTEFLAKSQRKSCTACIEACISQGVHTKSNIHGLLELMALARLLGLEIHITGSSSSAIVTACTVSFPPSSRATPAPPSSSCLLDSVVPSVRRSEVPSGKAKAPFSWASLSSTATSTAALSKPGGRT